MNEGLEEFSTVMIGCVIGGLAIVLISALVKDGSIIAKFAEAYADYFNGTI